MRLPRWCFPALLVMVFCIKTGSAQTPRAPSQTAPTPPAQSLAQNQTTTVKISLDDAIQMALQHNHTLLAARTTIQQNEAEETTANLRPNPVLLGDAQVLPFCNGDQFDSEHMDESAHFDFGVSYLFERGKKRQHRLQAAQDQTAVPRS